MARVAVKKAKYSREEVSKVLKLPKSELNAFAKEGLFDFADSKAKWIDHRNFERLRVAVSLKRELGVNLEGIDVILAMREKMERMQKEFNGFLINMRRQLGTKVVKNMKEIKRKV